MGMMGLAIIGIELFQTTTQGTVTQGRASMQYSHRLQFTLTHIGTPTMAGMWRGVLSVNQDGQKVAVLNPAIIITGRPAYDHPGRAQNRSR